MSELKEGLDYSFTFPESNNTTVDIKLVSGEFAGVIYRYGKVSVDEDENKENAYLSFEFDVIDNNDIPSLEESIEFKNRIGDVLTSIISKNFDKFENEVISEIRTVDSEASDI